MGKCSLPLLRGESVFRPNELVCINKSNELEEYCEILHKHDFIEIAYVIQGKGIHMVGSEKFDVSVGDLFLINYDVPHGFFSNPSASQKIVVYNCIFKPEFIDFSLINSNDFSHITSSYLFKSFFPDETGSIPDLKLLDADFNEIHQLFNNMYNEYKMRRKGYCDVIRANLIELIIKILRHLEESESIKKHHTKKNREIIDRAVEYLKSNYSSEIRLEDLAMKSFLSKNYFSKLFKEVTGNNISDYIQSLRIEEACRLLKATDMKVIDIAGEVGIKDLKFFYDIFRKHTGKTPGEYRSIW